MLNVLYLLRLFIAIPIGMLGWGLRRVSDFIGGTRGVVAGNITYHPAFGYGMSIDHGKVIRGFSSLEEAYAAFTHHFHQSVDRERDNPERPATPEQGKMENRQTA